MLHKFITIKNEFIGFHRYVDAPEEVKFLRDFHRHLFKVQTILRVTDSNREREFFIEQARIQKYLNENYKDKYFEESCEMIAEKILREFKAASVSVSEDGESEGSVLDDEQ